MQAIADTGYLVALVRKDDQYHAWAIGLGGQLELPLLTCEAVLSETAFHLESSDYVLAMLKRGAIRVAFDCTSQLEPLHYLAERYADRRPDLAVVVGRQHPDRMNSLVTNQIPHLAVLAGEAIGVVGPLVIPGRTSCLRCLDYIRASKDPAWPLILAQLATRQPDPPACDAVLTAGGMSTGAEAATRCGPPTFGEVPTARGASAGGAMSAGCSASAGCAE